MTIATVVQRLKRPKPIWLLPVLASLPNGCSCMGRGVPSWGVERDFS